MGREFVGMAFTVQVRSVDLQKQGVGAVQALAREFNQRKEKVHEKFDFSGQGFFA